jgi:hypothetical protein
MGQELKVTIEEIIEDINKLEKDNNLKIIDYYH